MPLKRHVVSQLSLYPLVFEGHLYYIETLQSSVQERSREGWKDEALAKPKLPTYVDTGDLELGVGSG